MPFRQGYSTITKLILLCFFLLNNVTTQQIPPDTDLIHLSGPAGMVTSPGYPETPGVSVLWNITVDEDHSIFLQFLDFELSERTPCSLDLFELYDSAFVLEAVRGRWCWDSFDKLFPTTYISNGNIFLLRLRTLDGHSRRGFKANYSSIPKDATTTSTANVKQSTAPNKVLPTHTTSTRNAESKPAKTDVLNKIPTTTDREKLVRSTRSSTTTVTTYVPEKTSSTSELPRTESSPAESKPAKTDVLNKTPTTTDREKLVRSTRSSTPNVTTYVPEKTSPTSELPRAESSPGAIIAIATSMIVAFIVIFIAAFIVWKYRLNNHSKDSTSNKPSKSLSRGDITTEVYDVIKEEDDHDSKSNYENTNPKGKEKKSIPATDSSINMQQLGVYSKEIVREELDTPDGTYETPDVKVYSYADPNEMKFFVPKK